MSHSTYFLSIALFLYASHLQSDAVISLFFRDYPAYTAKDAQSFKHKIGSACALAECCLDGLVCRNVRAGIWSIYAGFLELSSNDGQLNFPRKHASPNLHVIVTNKLTPIIMFEQTVHHWELAPDAPTALYIIEKGQDELTENYFWNTQKIDRIKDNVVPPEAVVIVAKPENIYIPLGITLTTESPNLILPPFYVKPGINNIENTLYILNLSYLFSHTKVQNRVKPKRVTTQVTG